MSLNKAKSEMYPFVDYTWNPMGGHCGHECGYCYMDPMKRFEYIEEKYEGEPRLIEKEMDEDLTDLKVRRRTKISFVGEEEPLIFVCSGNDPAMLEKENKLRLLKNLPSCNRYLLQTKNPSSFYDLIHDLYPWVILGTTVETNVIEILKEWSKAPSPHERMRSLGILGHTPKMVSIEPIMKFNVRGIIHSLKHIARPDFVSIGANTRKDIDLSEPSGDEVRELIKELSEFTEVHIKPNLWRILNDNGEAG